MAKITIPPNTNTTNPALQRNPIIPQLSNVVAEEVTQIARGYIVQDIKENISLTRNMTPAQPSPAVANAKNNQASTSMGLFGLPVYDWVSLSFPGTSSITGRAFGYVFDCAQVEVTQNRNIVQTNVEGMDGAIFEYISDKSFLVTIKAIITSNEIDVRPDTALQDILALCQIKGSVTVTSNYLNNNFKNIQGSGINQLVIENYTIMQKEAGMRDTYNVELTCWSDNAALYNIFVQTPLANQ